MGLDLDMRVRPAVSEVARKDQKSGFLWPQIVFVLSIFVRYVLICMAKQIMRVASSKDLAFVNILDFKDLIVFH